MFGSVDFAVFRSRVYGVEYFVADEVKVVLCVLEKGTADDNQVFAKFVGEFGSFDADEGGVAE